MMTISEILDILKVVGGSGGILAIIGYLLRILFDKLAIKRSHRLEVEREMTDKIHRYTEKYYVPIFRSAGQAAESLRKEVKDKADPHNVIAFFYLSRYFSVSYNISKEMEGIFLGDLVIEELLSRIGGKASTIIVSEPKKYLSEMNTSQIRKAIDPYELLADFMDKLQQEPLKSIFQRYTSWKQDKAGDVLQAANHLGCYSNLFLFGINTCYKEWYGEDAFKLSDEDGKIIKKELEMLKEEKLINNKQLNKYLQMIIRP